ncbi:hypothetical protein L1049_007463 [Liquidambar formosana]|uniref:DDE Tnp4 domain-containing protein n=1 Tax=Liquidambar formosana TaxID=63359 RepID=A0AAP0S1D5_LIQFO
MGKWNVEKIPLFGLHNPRETCIPGSSLSHHLAKNYSQIFSGFDSLLLGIPFSIILIPTVPFPFIHNKLSFLPCPLLFTTLSIVLLRALVLLRFSHSSSSRSEGIEARRRSSPMPSTLLHDSLSTLASVLNGVIRLQSHLLKQPEAVSENSTDGRWKWFKNCLGALNRTYVSVTVPEVDEPRYRTRENDIATNVLRVCSQDMQFIFLLPSWEGSATNLRVLRDAVSRRHGLKVHRGCYYLVDAGYPNGEGFLAPYRGQRYHLNNWKTDHQPTTSQEFFNMKHSSARNVIERCFGLLKRWMVSLNIASTLVARNQKHQWTPTEDARLVGCLYKLYTMGTWKCDIGFKSEYLVKLEHMLEAKTPTLQQK